jgi:site-specific recombinase XerD
MSTALILANQNYTPLRALVLDAVPSLHTRASYARALDDFFLFRDSQGQPPFSRALVHAHRAEMEEKGLAPATINLRLSAIRKLAIEAAANGLMSFEDSTAIREVKGPKQRGIRMGNWLTKQQAQMLLDAPPTDTLKGVRDRAALGLLVGCGLRRAECVAVTVEHVQQRDGRWCIVDLRGKGGRLRTVPAPAGVKERLDAWCKAAGIEGGCILRSMNRHGQVTGDTLSPGAVLDLVAEYAFQIPSIGHNIKPHDLRRTCAKLCRKAGGELEQIQMLLGHASVATTEKYLGSQQDLEHAPNDRTGLKFL